MNQLDSINIIAINYTKVEGVEKDLNVTGTAQVPIENTTVSVDFVYNGSCDEDPKLMYRYIFKEAMIKFKALQLPNGLEKHVRELMGIA